MHSWSSLWAYPVSCFLLWRSWRKLFLHVCRIGLGNSPNEAFKTLTGTATFVVQDGYLLGEAAPDYVTKVFPKLKLAKFLFKKARIESKSAGEKAHSEMWFHGAYTDLYMKGWTNNLTSGIDYTLYVDLIGSLGLNEIRKTRHQPAKNICGQVIKSIRRFASETAEDDDMTIVVIKAK